MERTDEEIMRAYQSGNPEAIRELFQLYRTRMLNFCFRLLGSRADAEEVAADVFLALVANRNGYDPTRKFSTWLYAIARHKCVSRMRKRRFLLPIRMGASKEADEPAWEASDPRASAPEAMNKAELATQVRRAVSHLPYEQREAIVLQQYHDCSYEQISEVLQCSLAKVKILIFRGKERLRVELAPLVKEG